MVHDAYAKVKAKLDAIGTALGPNPDPGAARTALVALAKNIRHGSIHILGLI